MPCKVSREEFGRIVEEAIAELPEPFVSFLEEVPIEIRTRPTPQQLEEAGLRQDELLFGLYVGHPRTERSVELSAVMPDVIYIFQEDHELACDRIEDLAHEIRTTVLHEIGHHFGMDEDDLEKLGYG
jgi:predicted Zn-dependent protease with MMP-like domain